MSQCTCTKDAEITCIVHPTERALKARIKELEAESQRLRDILYDDIGVFRKVKARGRPITATQVSDVLDAVQALLGGGE